MKISYISNSAVPGSNASSLQIMRMCDEFSKLGNKVILITPNTGLSNINPFNFYGIKNYFNRKELLTESCDSNQAINDWQYWAPRLNDNFFNRLCYNLKN